MNNWIYSVGNPAATVITSSPSFNDLFPSSLDFSALIANKLAEEPEFVVRTKEEFRNSDKFFSNLLLKRSDVSQNLMKMKLKIAVLFHQILYLILEPWFSQAQILFFYEIF